MDGHDHSRQLASDHTIDALRTLQNLHVAASTPRYKRRTKRRLVELLLFADFSTPRVEMLQSVRIGQEVCGTPIHAVRCFHRHHHATYAYSSLQTRERLGTICVVATLQTVGIHGQGVVWPRLNVVTNPPPQWVQCTTALA